MGISEIEKAISKLPPDELARFREWYEEFDAQAWDEQFEMDAKSGKLAKISDNGLEEYKAGNSKEL